MFVNVGCNITNFLLGTDLAVIIKVLKLDFEQREQFFPLMRVGKKGEITN